MTEKDKKSSVRTRKIVAKSSMPKGFQKNQGLGKDYEVPILDEIVFRPRSYPEFEIKQLDLCKDLDEEVDLWVTTKINLSKRDFFELMKIISADFETWREDRIVTEITIRLLEKKTKKAMNEINPRCATKYEETS